ncbi:MAG: hypothetical protein L6R38_003071 [Xanthoria sp. 2 TBL-2021]|nr:MAG: hypothetical protein L6R38_003071 [Xanthoria sp. 2 TBL-2021]
MPIRFRCLFLKETLQYTRLGTSVTSTRNIYRCLASAAPPAKPAVLNNGFFLESIAPYAPLHAKHLPYE